MRITILLLIVGLCIVSAKYLPYENESAVLLRIKRSNSEESSPSVENSNDSKNNEGDDEDDDDDDSSKEQVLNKERRKEEEQRKKLEEKLAKEQRKQEEKREKEERKRLERIEKEKRKEEEKHKKLLERAEKEEKKRQEKQRKELEKLQKEALAPQSNEDSFLETEEENSVELGGIWRNHVYIKYGLTLASTSAEKKAALDRYLKEELGINSNSTQRERQQAIVKLIETKLQNDTASKEAIRNQLLNQINSVAINKLQNKLNNNIEKLNNKTEILNNITLPWAKVAQQNLEEKKTFLQSISEFLSNVLPNWAPIAQNANSNSSFEQNVPVNINGISLEGKGVGNSGINIESGLPPADPVSNAAAGTVVPTQNVGASELSLNNSINSGQGISTNSSDAKNNSQVGSVIANNISLKSDLSDVALINSNINTSSSPSVISTSPDNTIVQNGDVPLDNVNKSRTIVSLEVDKNNVGSNILDSVISLKNIIAIESGIIPSENNATQNMDVDPSNKDISIASILGSIDNILNNVNNISESTIVPSINIDTSLSSGQLPNNENAVNVNDSNISSVNSSVGANSNIVSQSGSDIVQSGISNVSSSNRVSISETDVVTKEINIAKNVSEGSVNKEISITSVLDSIDNIINNVDKVIEATIAPSISIDSTVSSGQQSNNDNVVGVNESSISSINSSVVAKKDSNIVSQSLNDIVMPGINNVPSSNLVNISETGVVSKEINITKNISAGSVNKEISIASVLDSIDNIINNVDKVIEATIAPSINIDTSISNDNVGSINDSSISSINSSVDVKKDSNIVSQSVSEIVKPGISSVPSSNSVNKSESGVILNEISGTKNLSAEPVKKEVSISSVLDSIDNIQNNVDKASESTIAPSINVDASLSSGQASDINNVPTVSINESRISSGNILIDTNKDRNITSQSANNIQTAESGVISKNVSVIENVSAEPANKEISIDSSVLGTIDNVLSSVDQISESTVAPSIHVDASVSSGHLLNNDNVSTVSITESSIVSVNTSIEATKNSNITSKSVNNTVQTNLSDVSSSNNVQASESGTLSNQGKSNKSSKINDKPEVGLDSAVNNKVSSSVNVEISKDINETSDVILAEKSVDPVSFNKSSADVVGVTVSSVINTDNKTASGENKTSVDSKRNINASNAVNVVSQQNNSVSLESKVENVNNSINANSKNESISESSVKIESSLNNNTVNEITTSNPSIAESTYDVLSSISSQSNSSNIKSTVNVIDIATSSPVQSNISDPLNIKTVQIVNSENVTKSSNVSDILPSISVNVISSNGKNEIKASVQEIQSTNLIKNSSLLNKIVSLVGNDTSTSKFTNVGVTNAANIPSSVSSLNISNNSSVTFIDAVTTDSSIGNEILNESTSNTIAPSSPAVIADSTTIALSPEISTVVTTSADFIINTSNNISKIVNVADNLSAVNALTIESHNLTSAQKVVNESAVNVGTEASTEPALSESTIIDLGAPSTISEIVSNVNTGSSNPATESSLFDVGSTAQTDISQSLSTAIPAEPSTLAQVDGVTLPAEPGASVVEILPQI